VKVLIIRGVAAGTKVEGGLTFNEIDEREK